MGNIRHRRNIGSRTQAGLIGKQAPPCALHDGGRQPAADHLLKPEGRFYDQGKSAGNLFKIDHQHGHRQKKITQHHQGDYKLRKHGDATYAAENHQPNHRRQGNA